MKRLVSFLLIIFVSVFLVTGCTVVRIDTSDIDNIVDVVLSKDNSLYNHIGKGYKYYIPRGMIYIDTIEAGMHTNLEPRGDIDPCHYDSESEILLGQLFAQNFKQFLDK